MDKHTLDFAAEIGMARRIDDIDMHAFVIDRAVLCKNSDAALALDIVGVHHAFGDVLMRGERAGLMQQLIHQRRLAMIDVGDDRDIAQGARHKGS